MKLVDPVSLHTLALVLSWGVSEETMCDAVSSGVGGNLVAVQASRLSTALHQASRPGELPDDAVHGCPNPCSTFFSKGRFSVQSHH